MVDSRAKGQRGEYIVRDLLRAKTGYQFERVPASGALEYLKGDLYIPRLDREKNKFCIEVKSYADSHLTDKLFTQPKTNKIIVWWSKLKQQAAGGEQDPLLFFKYNRSKIFVATEVTPKASERYLHIHWLDCYVMLAEEWLDSETIEWVY